LSVIAFRTETDVAVLTDAIAALDLVSNLLTSKPMCCALSLIAHPHNLTLRK